VQTLYGYQWHVQAAGELPELNDADWFGDETEVRQYIVNIVTRILRNGGGVLLHRQGVTAITSTGVEHTLHYDVMNEAQ
jgi:hypothetical protein